MKNEPTILAIDLGRGYTKAVWSRHSTAGNPDIWEQLCFRSVCTKVSSACRGQNSVERVQVNVGQDGYLVGPKATVEAGVRPLHPDFINSPQHEALLLGAWHYMFRSTGRVTSEVDLLVLGLPVAGFRAGRQRLHDIGSRPRRVPVPREMQSAHGNEVEVIGKQVIVLPQPQGSSRLAAESALELADDGVMSMVIDIGYSAVNWFVSDGMTPLPKFCGSLEGGVSQLLKVVSARVGFDHGIPFETFGRIEKALVDGELNLGYKKIDMVPYRSVCNTAASAVVAEFLQYFDPSEPKVSRIFVCGGGATLYIDALRARLPHLRIEVMPDGIMSNCRGYWLSGQTMLKD